MACENDCKHSSIPAHLHAKGKSVSSGLSPDGKLYMFHDHVPTAEMIGTWLKYRGNDQSVIADELNPGGKPSDVLWDINSGEYLAEKMVLCLPVEEVRKIEFPDKNLLRRDPRSGAALPFLPEDYFHFDVVHKPEDCMYPHCEIRALKEGKTQAKMTKGMVNIAREHFQELVERFKEEWMTPESG